MKTPQGYLLLFWFMAFVLSTVGLTIYVRFNDQKVKFKETTTMLRKKAQNSINAYSFLLIIWWLAWFFAITGVIMFLLFFVFDIVDLKEL